MQQHKYLMNPFLIIAIVAASLSLQGVHAATIIARATSRPIGRSRGSRIARGLIAAIVIPSSKSISPAQIHSQLAQYYSVIGLGLLVLCCLCVTRLLKRRRNTKQTNSSLPMTKSGIVYGPDVGGGAAYGPVSLPQTLQSTYEPILNIIRL